MGEENPLMSEHAHYDMAPCPSAITLYSRGRFAEALAAVEPQIQAQTADAEALNIAGACLLAMDQKAAAEAYWRRAIAENPDYAEAHNNLGMLLHELERLPEAEAACKRAISLRPDFAEAHHNLSRTLEGLKRLPEAEAACRRAIAIRPDYAEAHYNHGCLLDASNRLSEAEAAYQCAIAIRPDYTEANNNLGALLLKCHRPAEAETAFRRAIVIRPDYAEAHSNLSQALQDLDRLSEAEAACLRAIAIKPDFANAYYNLGRLLQQLHRLPEAEAAYQRVLTIRPDYARAHNNLGKLCLDAGMLDEGLARYRLAVACAPDDVGAHSNLAYALAFQAEDRQVVLDECRRWSAQHEAPLRAERIPHANDRTPTRRLRIGYVSPDFREHCQSLFTVPLFSHHDHAQFEIFCYASVRRPDDFTLRIAAFTDMWRDVRYLDDRALAQQIRDDGIDILVDLTMHMANGRPLLFAHKPAPVQVAWLAYPGTTGIEAIDYRLTDPRLDPPDTDHYYSERSLRLPDAFWCYDPLTDVPTVNALPALSAGQLTFGCLNNPGKLTDRTLAMWAAVLREVNPARLILMAPMGEIRQRLMQRMEGHGIDTQRVAFVPFQPRADYLRMYHQIDLGLDTFPYNGHTTSLDSLWMGVPVVTRIGNTAVGRGGLSQLHQLGLTELAGDSDEAFVHIAVELAKDLPRLAQLRQSLRHRMEQSPLMDGRRFARHIEDAYRFMWQEWCL